MTDKELLEQAAKAAGMKLSADDWERSLRGIGDHWNPLTDDGDALRLAVKLGLAIDFWDDCVDSGRHPFVGTQELYGNDPYAATRRCIVKAAAEIGKGMK